MTDDEMTDFIRLVKIMRSAQRNFFGAERGTAAYKNALADSRKYERMVDASIAEKQA